jgi:hypothetical protein
MDANAHNQCIEGHSLAIKLQHLERLYARCKNQLCNVRTKDMTQLTN